MSYLYAAQSLAFFSASALWLLVWKYPSQRRLSLAAIVTAYSLALGGVRMSIAILDVN